MDRRAAADRLKVDAALRRVPDEPRWVDTRGMLLSGRAHIHAEPAAGLARGGFLVVVPDASLAAIVGHPSPDLVREAVSSMRGDVNLLAQSEDARAAAAALPAWRRRTAIVHVLPGAMPWEADEDPAARLFNRETAPSLAHVPEPLRLELLDALRGRTTARFVRGATAVGLAPATSLLVPMAAVWADSRPVAFCYPVWQTETLWDVSIDTLRPYRQRGYGGAAARALIRYMRARGRAPVWGALDTNTASRTLAARLGFIEAAGLAVFTAA